MSGAQSYLLSQCTTYIFLVSLLVKKMQLLLSGIKAHAECVYIYIYITNVASLFPTKARRGARAKIQSDEGSDVEGTSGLNMYPKETETSADSETETTTNHATNCADDGFLKTVKTNNNHAT